MALSDFQDIHKEFRNLVNEHQLIFAHNPLEGGMKLEKLISKAYITGKRNANLEHRRQEAKNDQ